VRGEGRDEERREKRDLQLRKKWRSDGGVKKKCVKYSRRISIVGLYFYIIEGTYLCACA